MKKETPFACPLDCFDACRLVAVIDDGRVTAIRGDTVHPLTRGKACTKGKKLLARLYHPKRLHQPLRRTAAGWRPVSWESAIDEMAQRFEEACRRWDSRAILYYADSGYGGVLKTVDHMFFNHLGGVTVPRGSLCWAAGIAAQRYDFGDVRGHAPHDIARARTVLIWGRNPLETSPHLIPVLEEVRAGGGHLVVIDPLRTATAAWADHHIAPQPGTDGALALAMARILVDTDRINRAYVDRHTLGYHRFRESLRGLDLKATAAVTGLEMSTIQELASIYADRRPACIITGYGLQRYTNGGQTVRCIDALAALTGQIGISGGGANFANRSIRRRMHPDALGGSRHAVRQRTFALPQLRRFLQEAQDPPVKAVMIAKANPLVQMPDLDAFNRAFRRIPFKVVVDLFMTDTARAADLVLPATHILEEEDLVYSSMFSPYLNYSHRVVDPPPGVISEYVLFQRLALRMGLAHYPTIPPERFLQQTAGPLLDKLGITWEELGRAPVRIPDDDIPWADGAFATPSGKFEFYSAQAAADGHAPLPVFIAPAAPRRAFPLRLLTTHYRHALHSQHFMDRHDRPQACLHPDEARQRGIGSGDFVCLESPHGRLEATAKPTPRIPPGVVQIYQGWWQHSGAVNWLTADTLSEMGENAAYFETFCQIRPLENAHRTRQEK
ncbi:MAG: molybdopterin-dependent oxidoreductase [Desulfobacterales bacterium]|nr:molybdopterin-dependent oxidoreductase [Desulfobacterales bacterium]